MQGNRADESIDRNRCVQRGIHDNDQGFYIVSNISSCEVCWTMSMPMCPSLLPVTHRGEDSSGTRCPVTHRVCVLGIGVVQGIPVL